MTQEEQQMWVSSRRRQYTANQQRASPKRLASMLIFRLFIRYPQAVSIDGITAFSLHRCVVLGIGEEGEMPLTWNVYEQWHAICANDTLPDDSVTGESVAGARKKTEMSGDIRIHDGMMRLIRRGSGESPVCRSTFLLHQTTRRMP